MSKKKKEKTAIEIYVEILKEIDVCMEKRKMQYEGFDINPIKFTFRGESAEFGDTKMLPSLYRGDHDEVKIINILIDLGHLEPNYSLNSMIDSQHYIAISRLLDITNDVNVALYFATEDCRGKDINEYGDGYLYVINYPMYFSSSSMEVQQIVDDLLSSRNDLYFDDLPKFIFSSSNNDRTVRQKSGFILSTASTKSNLSEKLYDRITIKKEDKKKLIKFLEDVHHVYEGWLFPEIQYQKNNVLDAQKYIIDSPKITSNEESDVEIKLYREVTQYLILTKLKVSSALVESKIKAIRVFRECENVLNSKVQILDDECPVKDELYTKIFFLKEEVMSRIGEEYE